jgi:hypothetical protein
MQLVCKRSVGAEFYARHLGDFLKKAAVLGKKTALILGEQKALEKFPGRFGSDRLGNLHSLSAVQRGV